METETLITREAAIKVGQDAVATARQLFPRATERTLKEEHIRIISRAIIDAQDRLRAVNVSYTQEKTTYLILSLPVTIHLGYVSGRNKYKGDAFSCTVRRQYTKVKDTIDNTYTLTFNVSRY